MTSRISIASLFACVLVAHVSPALSQGTGPTTIGIYRQDGGLQCQLGSGFPLEVAANQLKASGVQVDSQAKRRLPYDVPTECGRPTGQLDYFVVPIADLGKIKLGNEGLNPFHVWAFDMKTILVARSNNAANTFRMPATHASVAKVMGLRILPRSPAECVDVKAPSPGTPDAQRVSSAEARSMVVPPFNANLPRGKEFTVIFAVSAEGTTDSVSIAPALPERDRMVFEKAMKAHLWVPARYEGCAVPSTATIFVTSGH